MEENLNNTNTSGVSFLGLLALLFIGLKLTGYITWSWIWVLAPLWIPISTALGVFLCYSVTMFIFYALQERELNNNLKEKKEK